MASPLQGIVRGMAAGGASQSLENILERRLKEQNLVLQMVDAAERRRLLEEQVGQTAGLREMQGRKYEWDIEQNQAEEAAKGETRRRKEAYVASLPEGSPERRAAEWEFQFDTAIPSGLIREPSTPTATGHPALFGGKPAMVTYERDATGKIIAKPIEGAAPIPPASATQPALTPEALNLFGAFTAQTGQIPALGLAAGGRIAVANKAGELAAQTPGGINLATSTTDYKANQTALNRMVPFYHQTQAYANSALASMDFALKSADKVVRTHSPTVNAVKNNLFGHTLTGNPALSRFEVFVFTAARDYAKVTMGAAASIAALTDTAAAKADELANAAQTPEAFKAAMGAMQQDMKNVLDTQAQEIEVVRVKIRGGPSGQGSLTERPIVVDLGNGQTRTFPAGTTEAEIKRQLGIK